MGWPTPQDYNEAIQNPRICFDDAELKSGQPELTPLGLPRPFSGAFATVYQVNCPQKKWAVRCFSREFSDLQRRYHAISEHLIAANLPVMVGFEFLEKGIRVKGLWYPTLKMEWVDGEPINDFIARNLRQPLVLQSLVKDWIGMLGTLRQAGIAHGDLQHGNVLVSNGKLRLIDYDGMFVPKLAGWSSHEEGHRNYQHPARTGRDFGPSMDAFSGWVVLVSLSALMVDARLWSLLNGGDECLLFRREDFVKPNQSKAFQLLLSSPRQELRALADMLKSLASGPLASVPSPDSTSSVVPSAVPAPPSGLPTWMQSAPAPIRLEPLRPNAASNGAGTSESNPLWLIEHLLDKSSPQSIWNSVDLTMDRAASITIAAGAVALILAGMVGVMAWPFVAFMILLQLGVLGAVFWTRFKCLPFHDTHNVAIKAFWHSQSKMKAVQTRLNTLKLEIQTLVEPLSKIKQLYESLPARYQQFVAEAKSKLEKSTRDLSHQVFVLNSREADALRDFDAKYQQQMTPLVATLSALDSHYRQESGQMLTQMRNHFILSYMRSRTIRQSAIDGIGPKIKDRLIQAGIQTAADVETRDVRSVRGIGDEKAKSLRWWASQVRANAASDAPASLAQDVDRGLQQKYESQRQQAERQLRHLQNQQPVERQKVINEFAAQGYRLEGQLSSLRQTELSEQAALLDWYNAEVKRVRDEYSSREQVIRQRLAELNSHQTESEKNLFEARVAFCKQERELVRFRDLTIGEYLLRVYGIREALSRRWI